MPEPESLILSILREMRAEMATKGDIARLDAKIDDVRSEVADVRSEVHSLRADVASDLVSLEKRLGDQIATVRRAVMAYPYTTIGPGVLSSEIDARVRCIERPHNLDAAR